MSQRPVSFGHHWRRDDEHLNLIIAQNREIISLLHLSLDRERDIMSALDELKASIADLATAQQTDADAERATEEQTHAALDKIDELLGRVTAPGTSDADVQAATAQIKSLSDGVRANASSAAANAQSIADKLASIATPST
jgi:hypothetical protein